MHIPWKERYSIHYKEIDEQHQGLLVILNELVDLIDQKSEADQVRDIFRRLCQYALVHFKTEETYFRACGYEGIAKHEAEHAWFIDKLLELDRAYDLSDPALLEETLVFLKDWYVGHITKSDQEYASCLKAYYRKAKIKGVIFDFGNVIATFDNGLIRKQLATITGLSMEELDRKLFKESSVTYDYESGAISSKQFLEKVSELCDYTISEEIFIPIFTDIFTLIPETSELIRMLKSSYKLGLISNTNEWHFEHGIRTTEVFPLFDAVTLSFQVKALKPNPHLFEDALQKLGLMAEECVFIDDIAEYAEAANRHLLHGIHYQGHEHLLTDLRKLGVTL